VIEMPKGVAAKTAAEMFQRTLGDLAQTENREFEELSALFQCNYLIALSKLKERGFKQRYINVSGNKKAQGNSEIHLHFNVSAEGAFTIIVDGKTSKHTASEIAKSLTTFIDKHSDHGQAVEKIDIHDGLSMISYVFANPVLRNFARRTDRDGVLSMANEQNICRVVNRNVIDIIEDIKRKSGPKLSR
tara:strand:- start:4386 stop:4949 length:564 start_codon:yes stop_codon:yes gene_type:complete